MRRRPPKQGELRTDVSKATMFQGDGSVLRPTIQIAGRYGVLAKMTGIHQVTGKAENSSFPDIAGNDLNRCEVPALQHKIRANSKRTAVFFADSRLRVVGMGSGGWKRIALGGNKERFVRKKGFWFVKMGIFYGQREKACAKEVFVRKKAALSEVCKAFCK